MRASVRSGIALVCSPQRRLLSSSSSALLIVPPASLSLCSPRSPARGETRQDQSFDANAGESKQRQPCIQTNREEVSEAQHSGKKAPRQQPTSPCFALSANLPNHLCVAAEQLCQRVLDLKVQVARRGCLLCCLRCRSCGGCREDVLVCMLSRERQRRQNRRRAACAPSGGLDADVEFASAVALEQSVVCVGVGGGGQLGQQQWEGGEHRRDGVGRRREDGRSVAVSAQSRSLRVMGSVVAEAAVAPTRGDRSDAAPPTSLPRLERLRPTRAGRRSINESHSPRLAGCFCSAAPDLARFLLWCSTRRFGDGGNMGLCDSLSTRVPPALSFPNAQRPGCSLTAICPRRESPSLHAPRHA